MQMTTTSCFPNSLCKVATNIGPSTGGNTSGWSNSVGSARRPQRSAIFVRGHQQRGDKTTVHGPCRGRRRSIATVHCPNGILRREPQKTVSSKRTIRRDQPWRVEGISTTTAYLVFFGIIGAGVIWVNVGTTLGIGIGVPTIVVGLISLSAQLRDWTGEAFDARMGELGSCTGEDASAEPHSSDGHSRSHTPIGSTLKQTQRFSTGALPGRSIGSWYEPDHTQSV